MKHFFIFFFVIIGCYAKSQEVVYIDAMPTTDVEAIDTMSFADSLLQAAFIYKGVRYQYGGMSSNGMDCSGFICSVYRDLNKNVPHSSTSLSQIGEKIPADLLEPGDLLFFKGRSANSVGHVAMVSKIKDGLVYMIHASTSKGVIEEILQHNDYFMARWLFNKRVR